MYSTRRKSFRALGGIAHHKNWLAKTWRLLLNSTRVGKDNSSHAHEVNELEILKRFDKEEVWTGEVFTKHLVNWFAHIWIEVHWVNEINLRILF